MSRRELDREGKMYKELYQRHTEYIGAMVGHEFEQVGIIYPVENWVANHGCLWE